MSDSEKPFACPTVGCNMSFVNEDHLTVHKKKHDMMLNLGVNNKSYFFIADQTPTPSRSINCDEVQGQRLFQDLQNENPFDEPFRRAAEAVKNGGLTVPEVHGNDDTLNTPNFPPITAEPIKAATSTNHLSESRIKDFAESPVIIPLTPLKEGTLTDSTTNAEENSSINTTLEKDLTLQSSPSTSFNNNSGLKTDTHLPISSSTTEMQFLLKTQDGKVFSLVAAPVIEAQEDSLNLSPKEQKTKTKVNVNNSNKPDAKVVQNQNSAAVKMKLKHTLTKNGAVAESRPAIKNNENENKPVEQPKEKARRSVDLSKKQDILERNRASSSRSRAKRKRWIEQLQKRLSDANQTNANLQAQVRNLNDEVGRYKALLLLHKDCPITKAMGKVNAGVLIDSKVLAIKPNIKQLPVVMRPPKGTKRATTEKPIVPKKKPVIISSVPSQIILPKSVPTSNTVTLHGTQVKTTIPTINIVAPVIAHAESGKTILGFLHSDSTAKVPLLQNTFAVNENFNAASKTMGT